MDLEAELFDDLYDGGTAVAPSYLGAVKAPANAAPSRPPSPRAAASPSSAARLGSRPSPPARPRPQSMDSRLRELRRRSEQAVSSMAQQTQFEVAVRVDQVIADLCSSAIARFRRTGEAVPAGAGPGAWARAGAGAGAGPRRLLAGAASPGVLASAMPSMAPEPAARRPLHDIEQAVRARIRVRSAGSAVSALSSTELDALVASEVEGLPIHQLDALVVIYELKSEPDRYSKLDVVRSEFREWLATVVDEVQIHSFLNVMLCGAEHPLLPRLAIVRRNCPGLPHLGLLEREPSLRFAVGRAAACYVRMLVLMHHFKLPTRPSSSPSPSASSSSSSSSSSHAAEAAAAAAAAAGTAPNAPPVAQSQPGAGPGTGAGAGAGARARRGGVDDGQDDDAQDDAIACALRDMKRVVAVLTNSIMHDFPMLAHATLTEDAPEQRALIVQAGNQPLNETASLVCRCAVEEAVAVPIFQGVVRPLYAASERFAREDAAVLATAQALRARVSPHALLRHLELSHARYELAGAPQPYAEVVAVLRLVWDAACPLGAGPTAKARLLVRASRTVRLSLTESGLEGAAAGVSADDLLPIFIFAVAWSAPPNLASTCHYLEQCVAQQLLSSEAGYCLALLQTALNAIPTLTELLPDDEG